MKTFTRLIAMLILQPLFAQQNLQLTDMSTFQSQAGNWFIVADVAMNPDVDIHQKQEEEPKGKKKKRSSQIESPEAVTYTKGTGILLNMNDEEKKSNLLTNWEHGDIWLELEVMLPKGSNSGIYLQGRYEVQLFDSWGVKQPKFSDIGGIYRNWEREPDKIYMGKPPISNPAKAPGLWQKMEILFIAPKFDEAGNKTANARFDYVKLNGVLIHINVEVPKLTGGPISKEEAAMGPIMIQGDHGPVAIKNFSYKLLSDASVELSGLSFKEYKGTFASAGEFLNTDPINTGNSMFLTCEVLENDDNYLLVYTGQLEVGEDDEYEFRLGYTGGAKFMITNDVIVDKLTTDSRGTLTGKKRLTAGTYPFEIQVIKSAGWQPPRLGLSVKGTATHPKKLHSYGSYPDNSNSTSPIFLDVMGNTATIHRGFADSYVDETRTRLSHTVAVGDPSGVHYVFDLKSSNLISMWRGDFIDATPMWNSRGDGSFRTRGATEYTYLNQSLAYIGANESFPAIGDSDFTPKGYTIDQSTGRPTFNHIYRGLNVVTSIIPDSKGNYLNVTVEIEGSVADDLFYKVAEGSSIESVSNGAFAIDDKRYYIQLPAGVPMSVRDINGKKELLIPVKDNSITYSIIW